MNIRIFNMHMCGIFVCHNSSLDSRIFDMHRCEMYVCHVPCMNIHIFDKHTCNIHVCHDSCMLMKSFILCDTSTDSILISLYANTSRMNECVAVCCSVLQCVAVCCSVLQCVAVFVVCTYLQMHESQL